MSNNKSLNTISNHDDYFRRIAPEEIGNLYGEKAKEYYLELERFSKSALALDDVNVEKKLARFDNIVPIAYRNIYTLGKKVLKDNRSLIISESDKGYTIDTPLINGVQFPLFSISSDGVYLPTDVDFYQTEINRERRIEIYEDLYQFREYLISHGGSKETIGRCEMKLLELADRKNFSSSDEKELYDLQNKTREQLFEIFGIDVEFLAETIPHRFPEGFILSRRRLGANVRDNFRYY